MERSKVGMIPYLDKEVLKRRDCLEDSCWDGGFAFGLLPGRSMGSIRSQHQGDCRLCMWDIRTYRGKGELHAMPYNCLRRPPSLSLFHLFTYIAHRSAQASYKLSRTRATHKQQSNTSRV